MGNTSVVASGVKAQGDAAAKKLYTLVALGDGGDLVSLTKEAMSSKPRDYTKLDHAIMTKVKPFLYSEGEGMKVPVSELVKVRNGDREKSIKISKDKQKKTNDFAALEALTHQNNDCVQNKPGNYSLDLILC